MVTPKTSGISGQSVMHLDLVLLDVRSRILFKFLDLLSLGRTTALPGQGTHRSPRPSAGGQAHL